MEKTEIIKIRVDEKFKKMVEDEAQKNNVTVSELIRSMWPHKYLKK